MSAVKVWDLGDALRNYLPSVEVKIVNVYGDDLGPIREIYRGTHGEFVIRL